MLGCRLSQLTLGGRLGGLGLAWTFDDLGQLVRESVFLTFEHLLYVLVDLLRQDDLNRRIETVPLAEFGCQLGSLILLATVNYNIFGRLVST